MSADETKKLLSVSFNSYTYDQEHGLVCDGDNDEDHKDLAKHGITDTMMYRTRNLTTWEAFSVWRTTIWFSSELWSMIGRLTVVALAVCIITLLVVPDPAQLKGAKFTEISKFLNVVVGLLLGFFLSSSMNRWYSCVNGFLELLDAIRNLQMQFVALGVPEKEAIMCYRYSFASAWLLYGQLLIETRRLADSAEGNSDLKEECQEMWNKLSTKVARIDRTGQTTLLTKHEAETLSQVRDPPGMMWMWVGALIGRIAQDGWIPGMPTPTYGRIMNLCQSGHGGIRQVRAAISVQAPFTYTHMLATLVHMNNLLNAFTFGVVSGVAIGCWMIREGIARPVTAERDVDARGKEVTQDWQNMAITFLYCFFGPLLYQALLLIGMHLAQPFDSEHARIPLDRLLHQLEQDMCDGRDMVEEKALPFEKPCFKPVKPAAS